jgi:hypothetical protein
MITFKKQSLIDWQATIGKQSFAWITKESAKNYSVRFCGYEPQDGFPTLHIAKKYVQQFKFAE